MKKIFLLLSFLIACEAESKLSEEEYRRIGYKEFLCNKIDFIDTKSDSNPYYKIYSEVEIIDNKKSGLILRCFDTYNCIPEVVSYQEVICQKLFIIDNKASLYKEWDNHTILVNNIKTIK